MDKLAFWLLENQDSLSIVTYLLITAMMMGLALHKEWLVLGRVYSRQLKDYDEHVTTLAAVNEKLITQRILNERAAVTMETQAARIKELELDLARAEGQQWRSPEPQPRQRTKRGL